MLISYSYVFLSEMFIQIFYLFLIGLIVLLRVFRIFWIQVLHQICVLHIFSLTLLLGFSFS